MKTREIKELVAEITRHPDMMLNYWHIPTSQQKNAMMRVLLAFPREFSNLLSALHKLDPLCESQNLKEIYNAFFIALTQGKTGNQERFLKNAHSRNMVRILVLRMWSLITLTNQLNLLHLFLTHSDYTSPILMELCESNDSIKKSVLVLALQKPNNFLFKMINHYNMDEEFILNFIQSTAINTLILVEWDKIERLTKIRIINFLLTDDSLVDKFLIPICLSYESAFQVFLTKILDQYDEGYLDLFSRVVPLFSSKQRSEVFKFLTICHQQEMPYLKQLVYLDSCLKNHEEYDIFLVEMFCECFLNMNVYIFSVFPNHLDTLSELAKEDLISIDELDFFSSFALEDYSDEERRFVSSLIPQFRFRIESSDCSVMSQAGVVNTDGMLLTIAQTKARKKLKDPNAEINCTLLYVKNRMTATYQINAFFNILKNAGQTLSERFMMRSEGHWISGVVWVDDKREAHLFLMDSMFVTDIEFYPTGFFKAYYAAFPNGKIYAPNVTRQNSSRGCAIFAYEDCMKSQSMYDHYFGGDQGLLNYILKNISVEIPVCDPKLETDYSLEINLISLPIRFLSLMQSRRVYELSAVESKKNPNFRINKKNETAEEAISRHFIESGDRKINDRINYKMNKMASLNRSFLFSHENIKEIVSGHFRGEFTLPGLRERYNDYSDYGLIPLPDEVYMDDLRLLAQIGRQQLQVGLNDLSNYPEGQRLIAMYNQEIGNDRPPSPMRMLDVSISSCE